MKLLYIGREAWEEAYIKTKLPDIDIVFHLGSIGDTIANSEDAEILSVFVNHRVDVSILNAYPKIKLIATRSTGFDHIDIAEAHKRNIAVVSVPFYGVNTVAEFAFALLLALSRRICEARNRVAEIGSFSQDGLTGFDLQGKTLGVVGCGHIGLHMVKIAHGFGMNVLVYDVRQDETLAKSLDFAYATLDEVLAKSDILTIHVPYNEHTHHLINKENITKIKKGAYLINTARGAIVETSALVEALKQEIIAGAGLDVLEDEADLANTLPLISDPTADKEKLRIALENEYLIKHPRVIVTPHVAFDTGEAIRRILDTTAENIIAFQKGTPQNLLK